MEKTESGMIVLGDDEVRIERGPKMKSATATRELLGDQQTAPHYKLGGPDAYGYPIQEGESFDYLDWGGHETQGEFVYYVYAKFPLDADAIMLPNGKPNPYYVPEDQREAVDGKSRSHYEYVFCEMGVAETEEEAIALAEDALRQERVELPKSHLDHLDKALSSPRMNFDRSIKAAREA
jgi:hypothetical protein